MELFLGGGRRRGLLGDDFVLDFVVGDLGNDFLLNQFVLSGVRTPINHFLGVDRADSRERLELFLGDGVNVQQRGGWSSGWPDQRLFGTGVLRLGNRQGRTED